MSVTADLLYIDTGSLNFAVTANTAFFSTRAIDYPPILSDYYILNAAIAEGLRKFSGNVEANPEGIQIKGRKMSGNLPKWFYDFLLFQVTLLINTDLEVYRKLIRIDRSLTEMPKMTSLSRQLRKEIPLDEVKKALIEGFEKKFGIVFKKEEELIKDEQKAAKTLLKAKYGLDKWNIHGIEPFLTGMGKTSLEVIVAYPPTLMCRQLIELVKDVTSDLQDDVTVRVWMRGKGSDQHGVYPEMSEALISAEKCSRIPAIIINGELKFDRTIPSKKCLRSAVVAALPKA